MSEEGESRKGWSNPQIIVGLLGLGSAFYASFVLTGERAASQRAEDRFEIILKQEREITDRQYQQYQQLSERIAVLETRVGAEEHRARRE